MISEIGSIYLDTHQLESAKRCFLGLLAWPNQKPDGRACVLHSMASYHKERQEWGKMIECCEKGLTIYPQPKKDSHMWVIKVRLIVLLADGAEAQGNMSAAHDYDEKAKNAWLECGLEQFSAGLLACYRGGSQVLGGREAGSCY